MTTTLNAPPAPPEHRNQPDEEPVEIRRSTGAIQRTDIFGILGALVAAISLSAWLGSQLLIFQGILPFIVFAYVFFVAFYAIVTRLDHSGIAVRDRLIAVMVHSLAILLFTALAVVVIFTFVKGFTALLHVNFFTTDMSQAGPLDPLTNGGILHAISGTLIMISIALVICVPLGVATAIYLSEFSGRYARLVRTVVEAMTALPSIVAGLFILSVWILGLHFQAAGFAGSLALVILMLPITIRSTEEMLRLVPGSLREASYALGVSRWRTIARVIVPTALPGIVTGVMLGVARVMGETAPVLLLVGATSSINPNLFSGAQGSLPVFIFNEASQPEATAQARAWAAALTLILLVLLLNLIARLIAWWKAPADTR